MVMDVIRAVQETIAYFCQSTLSSATPDGSNITGSSSSGSVASKPLQNHYRYYSSLAALGGSGRSSLVAVVNPLMVLISDGLLPPQTRAIFASKPKSRIWALVEDSCRPCAFLSFLCLNQRLPPKNLVCLACSGYHPAFKKYRA